MTEIPKDDIQTLYASLMTEVKYRLSAVDANLAAMKAETDNHRATFLSEFCYLQLRRVTELIALAVLAAHNPHPEFRTKDFLKDWNPDTLFRRLAKLNPEAFPQPVTVVEDPTYGTVKLLLKVPDFQARDEICRIYNECSDKLHTGHLRAVLKQRSKIYDRGFIRKAMHNIFRIIDCHITRLPDGSAMHGLLNLASPGLATCRWLGPYPPYPTSAE